jgi:ATP-dependent DNA helicase RecG
VTVEQLSGPHLSRPTNPSIAEAFHRTGAVEVWGRGTNRVIEMCERHGAAPPVFEERQGFLIVTFKASLIQGGVLDSGATEGREKSKEKGREKSREKVLALLAANPKITTEAMANDLDLSRAGVEKIVRNLKKEGRLKRVGPDKGGHWEVAE